MKTCSFKRNERLKRNEDIKQVFDNGILFKSASLNIYLLKRDTGSRYSRAGFVIKKLLYNKKKVLRNRFRRLLKEAYIKAKHILPEPYDIVILAKKIKKDTPVVVLEREITNGIKKIIKKDNTIIS